MAVDLRKQLKLKKLLLLFHSITFKMSLHEAVSNGLFQDDGVYLFGGLIPMTEAAETWSENHSITRDAFSFIERTLHTLEDHNETIPTDDDALQEMYEMSVVFGAALMELEKEEIDFKDDYFIEECNKKSTVAKVPENTINKLFLWLCDNADNESFQAVVSRIDNCF